jgi:glutamate racemase
MNKQPITFFDSGVGGLPYLELARGKLPYEYFYYFADHKNYPYGNKTIPAIKKSVIQSIGRIIDFCNPKIIVIACNTASVVALNKLRECFAIPFIGVVPAIKPAAGKSKNGRIAVLATERTVKDDYLEKLIQNFAQTCIVIKIPAGEIRDLVEERFFSSSKQEKLTVVARVANKIKKQKVDSVVIGCTHFLLVEKEISTALGKNISLIDSREGVFNQLIRIIKQKRLAANRKNGMDHFYITGKSADNQINKRYNLFAQIYNLKYYGTIA